MFGDFYQLRAVRFYKSSVCMFVYAYNHAEDLQLLRFILPLLLDSWLIFIHFLLLFTITILEIPTSSKATIILPFPAP